MMSSTTSSSSPSWGIRSSFQFLSLLLFTIAIILVYFTQNPVGSGPRSAAPPPESPTTTTLTDGCTRTQLPAATLQSKGSKSTNNNNKEQQLQLMMNESSPSPSPSPGPNSKCNVFSGKWVFDNQTYPLYKERECPYMSPQLACEKYGRKDLSYQFWRWQPHHCDLPRFNGTALLERLRNKRLVYVGDSLNRGQWVSMVCLVQGSISSSNKFIKFDGNLCIFKAMDYNATIEYYWAPLLVESNSDDPFDHHVPERIARTQAIEKHARFWTDADFLIFDSYLWWRQPTMKILWGSFGSEDAIYKDVEMLKGYEMSLRTWSDWVEIHVNHTKTRIFWMSISPTHEMSEEWGGAKGSNCINETEPIFKQDYQGIGSDPNMIRIYESEIKSLRRKGVNIQLLNITQLSDYRKEAHPSIYRKQWSPLSKEKLDNPKSYADCDHWCLPGVPDTWNEILYAYIFNSF